MNSSKKLFIKIKDKPITEVRQNERSVGTKFRKESMPSRTNSPLPRNERSPSPSTMTKRESQRDVNTHIPISRTIFAKTREPDVSPRIGSSSSRLETDRWTVSKKMIPSKSISFAAPKYMVTPTFRRGTLFSANTEKTYTRDWKKPSSFNVLKNNISSENMKKSHSILVESKISTPNQTTRSSMKDMTKKSLERINSFTANSNNSDRRNKIKFKVIDPRAGLNNSSDRNNNQVDEGEPETGEASEGDEEGGTEGTGTEKDDSQKGASESLAKSGTLDNPDPLSEKEEPEDEEITDVEESEPKKSEGEKSEAEKSEAGKSEAEKSEAEKFEAEKSEAEKSEAEKSEAEKSEAKKSEAEKSEAQKSEAQKSEAQKSEAQKSEAQKSEAQKSEAQKSEAQKSEAKKSEVEKSEVEESETVTAKITEKEAEESEAVEEVEKEAKKSSSQVEKKPSIKESPKEVVPVKSKSKTSKKESAAGMEVESKNFINLIQGLKIISIDPKGHFIRINNVSDKPIDIQSRILIQRYDDAPYAVYKFPSETVMVPPGGSTIVWANGAPEKDDKTLLNFIFPNQQFWACNSDITKTILTEMNDEALSYLTSIKVHQICKPGEGGAGKPGKSETDFVPVGRDCGCGSLDSLIVQEKPTTKFGKDKTAPQKKTRVCELKTFDLSSLCDDFDKRDKDGIKGCIMCSCFTKKPVRQIEICCDDDDEEDSLVGDGIHPVDSCQKLCKKMGRNRGKNDKFLDDDAETNRSVKVRRKPDVDYNRGKETGISTKRKAVEKYDLNDDFCDEFGNKTKYEKSAEAADERRMTDEETPENNFDKFNKFMKGMCEEFDLDIMKKKDEKTESHRVGETDSCNNLCNRNKIGGGRKSFTKLGTGISEKTEDSNAYKGYKERDNDKDSCRGVCSRKTKSHRIEDDSGSDYFGNSKTKKFRDSDDVSYRGMANKGEKYSGSDDHYAGKKWGGKKDSCTNLCSRNESSYEGGDSSYSKDHGRPERSCDCTSYQKKSSLNDQSFIKQFCLELDKEIAQDADDCSKYVFCGSCNRNYSNNLRGEPEPFSEIVDNFYECLNYEVSESSKRFTKKKRADNINKNHCNNRWECDDENSDNDHQSLISSGWNGMWGNSISYFQLHRVSFDKSVY